MGKWRIFVESLWLCEKLIDREKSRSLSWLFDCHRNQARNIKTRLFVSWLTPKRAEFSVLFISLSHSAYITFRIIMSFRKPCHMPFRTLIRPLPSPSPNRYFTENSRWVPLSRAALIGISISCKQRKKAGSSMSKL